MNTEPSESRQISKFNEAGFSIMRLNKYWLKAEYYARKGSFKQWKFMLDTIWRELYHDVKRINDPKLMKKNNSLMLEIANSKTKAQLYFNLSKRHEFLKEIQDLSGKSGDYKDEDEWGFE